MQNGSDAAYRKLVSDHADRVYNTLLGLVQSQAEAEDLAQEVFIEVFQSIGGFKGEAKLSTWIYRIAVRKGVDRLRHQKRKKRFVFVRSLFGEDDGEPLPVPDFVHPGVLLENKERAAVLFQAIGRLPENQRIAFTLHKVEDMSYAEIGEVLNTSISAIESLLHRAKTNLRKILKDYYESDKDSKF